MNKLNESMELLAACGLYCGACYHYRAGTPEGTHLLEEASQRELEMEGYTCQGCRSNKLYIHTGCAECKIRECTDQKGILHCGACTEFPCEKLTTFQNDGRIHHLDILKNLAELNRKGNDLWLQEQARLWTCSCGNRFSWYEETCSRCGSGLPSYGSDPTRK